ncbi:MAG: hypothetical protein GXP54_12265, partial [Deltaproteobacteria bacterium]|nr:hypothetical protein [Deltaproteobacteria bacterium]
MGVVRACLPMLMAGIALACGSGSGPGSVVINEVSCKGSDWIELENRGGVTVTLDGWSVSDRETPSEGHEAVIRPGLSLGPGELTVLYRGRDFEFGIHCGDEVVSLFDADGVQRDRVEIPVLHRSQTWGVRPSDPRVRGVLCPTAGAPNAETPRFPEDVDAPVSGPTQIGEGPCHDAGLEAGALVCVDTLLDAKDFEKLSVLDTFSNVVDRVTKYTLPVEPDEEGSLPPLAQNANLFPFHQEFLVAVFPKHFQGLDAKAYGDLVLRRATRKYWSGALYRFTDTGDYGFSVVTDPADQTEALDQGELAEVQKAISAFTRTPDPAWVPLSQVEMDRAFAWNDPPFPIRLLEPAEAQGFRVYTPGTGYGWVRIMDLVEFNTAVAGGTIGWKDIVVLNDVPADLDVVVAGIVTAVPQTELSHLALRTGLRNTPNLFHKDALALFKPWEGRLVRLDAYADAFSVDDQVTLDEAEAWWDANRPRIDLADDLDDAFFAMPDLREVDTTTKASRDQLLGRFGGKAARLAVLYSLLPEKHQVRGFMVPFAWYERFLDENRIETAGGLRSYREYLADLASSPGMTADAAGRRAALETLREHARTHGIVPDGLEDSIRRRIVDVFGAEDVMVRFRSSSNAEDSLEFSGAGLYESESACAADSYDEDDDLPSRCDPSVGQEKTLRNALITVWSSLWSFRAWEERAWFQMDQTRASMAILVNARQAHEIANGVLTTGVPGHPGDRRYLINAQWMDVEVVQPEPGVQAERDVVDPNADSGEALERWGRSNLLPEGYVVLRKSDLAEMSRVVSDLLEALPMDDLGT